MAATRLELNLMRLLSRCEALAAERRDPEEWRLEKVRRDSAFSLGRDWPGKLPAFSSTILLLEISRGRQCQSVKTRAVLRPLPELMELISVRNADD